MDYVYVGARLLVALICLGCTLVPMATASLPALGTTVLVDASDDIAYSALHSGPRDRGHIDIATVDVLHVPADETLEIALQLADLQDLDRKVSDFHFTCLLASQIQVEGFPVGNLTLQVHHYPGNPELQSSGSVRYGKDTRALWIHLEVVRASPGLFRFGLYQPELEMYGEQLGNFFVSCSEAYFPAGAVGPSFHVNRDEAKGDSTFDLLSESAVITETEPTPRIGPWVGGALTIVVILVALAARARK